MRPDQATGQPEMLPACKANKYLTNHADCLRSSAGIEMRKQLPQQPTFLLLLLQEAWSNCADMSTAPCRSHAAQQTQQDNRGRLCRKPAALCRHINTRAQRVGKPLDWCCLCCSFTQSLGTPACKQPAQCQERLKHDAMSTIGKLQAFIFGSTAPE
jgi:hypothetical protein